MYNYKGKGFDGKFVFLGAWEDNEIPTTDKECCKKYGFTVYTFQEILEKIFLKGEQSFESSGNEIFDEFWTGIW